MSDADDTQMSWSSDAIARLLREIGLKYLAMSPGSSFRGLHESIVNVLDNREPEILTCLHEEHSVAIAHGYAKATGEPLGVLVHANVGLMHATMAVYNAFCDRVPMMVLGGVAPMDAGRRISPAHWYHSVLDQGALVRDYVKWDDQPISVKGTIDAILRGNQLTRTAPTAPVYISIDQRMQEEPLPSIEVWPAVARYAPPSRLQPDAGAVRKAAEMLVAAKNPLILAGRVSLSEAAWAERIRLAEALGAVVLTDQKTAAAFPTDHPLHGTDPYLVFTDEVGLGLIREADVVLSLDWIDMVNLFRRAWPNGAVPPQVIHCSIDRLVHKGWTRDHQALPAVDLDILAEPCATVPPLLREIEARGGGSLAARAAARLARRRQEQRPKQRRSAATAGPEDIGLWDIGAALSEARGGRSFSAIRVPLGWHAGAYAFRHPLDFLGYDGSGGIGSGPGQAVGAALGLIGSGRVPIALLGDGDFLMGATALWTATRHRIPLLVIIANNKSYYVDEEHQRNVSRQRNRSIDKAWIGQRIDDPPVDLAAIAVAQGCTAERVTARSALDAALQRGIAAVDAGRCHVIDVNIVPDYQGLLG